jgi:hypothetical protein
VYSASTCRRVGFLAPPRRGATAGPCLRPPIDGAEELMLPAREVVETEAAFETGRASGEGLEVSSV